MKDDIKDQYCNRFSKPLNELYRDKTFQFFRKRPIKTKECMTFDFICLYYLYIALTVLHSRMFFFVLVVRTCGLIFATKIMLVSEEIKKIKINVKKSVRKSCPENLPTN